MSTLERGSPAARARVGRPRNPDVDEAILSTTVRMLAESGYARLTMDQVATSAGVGKASLYRRWPTKDALIVDAVRHQFTDDLPSAPSSGSLHGDMLAYLRSLVRYLGARIELIYAVAGELLTNRDLAEEVRAHIANSMLATLRVIIRRAALRGELAADADQDLLASLPLALLYHLRLRGEPIDERQAKRIADQFFSPRTGRGGHE